MLASGDMSRHQWQPMPVVGGQPGEEYDADPMGFEEYGDEEALPPFGTLDYSGEDDDYGDEGGALMPMMYY